MDFFGKIRDNNKIISAIVKWQKTVWFPIAYAILAVVACTFGMYAYVPVFYIYAISAVFAALFNDDIKVMLVPLLLTYFAIGGDTILDTGISTSDVMLFFNPIGLVQLVIGGVIVVLALMYRLIRDGIFVRVVTRRGIFMFGLLALALSVILNGVFSAKWEPFDLAFGLFQAVGLIFVYFIVLAMSDKTRDIISYACKICVIGGLAICAEVLALTLKLHLEGALFFTNDLGVITDVNKNNMVLGWGVANMIAGVLVILIPAAMYIAHSLKHGSWACLAAVLFYAMSFWLRARTSMLMGGIMLVACAVVCCLHGVNRKPNRIILSSVAAAFVIVFVSVFSALGWENFEQNLVRIADFLRFDDKDSGRFEIWANGVDDFASAPVFGVGFTDGGIENGPSNIYSNMYHNIVIQLIGSMGIVGVLAMLWHLKNFAEVLIRRFSVERLLLLALPITVLLTSLLDNFFFYFDVQIFYGLFLALAEIQFEGERKAALSRLNVPPIDKKPRVTFTFIEAGKGHIMPELAVCEAFEKKYGDRVEVVRSQFYTETNDEDMTRFENGFIRTVELQSRSRIYGKASTIAVKVTGDALAQQFVMCMRYPDSKANKPSVEHLRELSPDLVFTTHWATAVYANRLKGSRPYTMLFCPDAYSNGMFNVDVNDFLISTPEGLDKVRRRRMYAGGNSTLVPYPIRGEAFALSGKRKELRKELGIEDDAFTVLLSDGGYGMAQLVATVKELAKSTQKMTVIAVCGINEKGCEQLRSLKTSPSVDLRVYGFTNDMLKFVAAADLFVGKSGANSMAEPTFFGVPIIITKCITTIESGIKKYYVKKVGNARYIPNPVKAAEAVRHYAEHPDELKTLAARSTGLSANFGAEAIADLIYDRVCRLKKLRSAD